VDDAYEDEAAAPAPAPAAAPAQTKPVVKPVTVSDDLAAKIDNLFDE
jgi:hypothetical protein